MMCRHLRLSLVAVMVSALLVGISVGQPPPPAPALANSIDTPPMGWAGPIFELSKDYPTALPTDTKPWKAINFTTQPMEYIQAVLAYCLEGNEAADWKVQNNTVRKWYHAPGLLSTGAPSATPPIPAAGREFIHGMTRERNSGKKELHDNQTERVSNWAVGFYNPIGAFTIGKVWANPAAPDTSAVKFDDGAVAFKLLFTSATDTQVPFLANSMKWQGNIDMVDQTPPSIARAPHDVLLLQVDVAVRDDNAPETGWVFGTFMYQSDAPGAGPLQRLVPVGLMWGNDPGFTKAQYDMGQRATQTWLNTTSATPTISPHFGWSDRLNGPVDNPRSSCLSCHARAVAPYKPRLTAPQSFPPPAEDPDDPAKKFFSNTMAGAVYDGAPAGSKSLDYSLQLAVGTSQFHGPGLTGSAAPPRQDFNFRGGEPESAGQAPPVNQGGKAKPPGAPPAVVPVETNWALWAAIAAGALLLIVVLSGLRSKSRV